MTQVVHSYPLRNHGHLLQHEIHLGDHDPSQAPAVTHVSGLANANVQSASFKMLQKALEMDLDLSQLHGVAKAPRIQQGDRQVQTCTLSFLSFLLLLDINIFLQGI